MKGVSSLLLVSLFIVFSSFNTAQCRVKAVKGDWVKIVNKESHFRVTIDYTDGPSRLAVGAEYMELVKIAFPEFEENADLYLDDFNYFAQFGGVPPYEELIQRAHQILSQVPAQYREEIEGMTSQLSGGDVDLLGDGLLSVNEFYILSLMPDVMRAYACSAISFFGANTRHGETLTGRNLEWEMGSKGNMNKMHAVTTIIDGDNSIALIGFLGSLGAITAVNDNGIFGAIFDSPIGVPAIDCLNKNSYFMDLRYALEHYDNKDSVSFYMIDPSRNYTYNHNILLSDRYGSQVVENYVLGQRSIRYDKSRLNPGVEWPYGDALGVVNSFVLEGKPDNHTNNVDNIDRWASFLGLTDKLQWPVRLRDVKEIMLYHEGPVTSHIYHEVDYTQKFMRGGTLQQVLYNSRKKRLKVHFSPESESDQKPEFEHVPLNFHR